MECFRIKLLDTVILEDIGGCVCVCLCGIFGESVNYSVDID